MNPEPSFGLIVRERRQALGLTQAELARRVGCAIVTVRKVETDALRPSVQIAERLALALSVPEAEQLAFVHLARAAQPLTPLPGLPLTPEEIGQADLSGRAIRGYQLGERIGSGGFGVVYRAVQTTVGRDVAIKIILPQYADQPDFIRRFEAEAQLVARLEHPYIVPLYDFWREPGVAYLIMRLLRGGSLETLPANGPLTLPTATSILTQIGLALHTAHQAGVVHRDLKPANILLDQAHNAYLTDFGVAKDLNLTEQTQAGAIIGSPAYFSPEQINAEPVKPHTDIYCLGIMLYELLAGQKPFTGPSPLAYIQQHLSEPLPSLTLHNPALPRALDAVLARTTAKNPAERYPDLLSLLADFQQAVAAADQGQETGIAILPGPLSAVSGFSLAELTNPYKGLRSFAEADAADFFGRDTLIQALLGRLSESDDVARFLAVVGPSGSGKSSAVKAGLVPALRRGGLPGSDGWFIVEMIPGPHPLEELEATLLRIAVNPPESLLNQLQEDERGLLRAVTRVLPADPVVELVLVIDQFEELFTLVADEAVRRHFLDSLLTAVIDSRSRLRVIITLRADFTDRPLQYVDFGELLRQRTEFILPLSPDELAEAITQPVARLGLTLEPGLVTQMIHEVGQEPGTLPLLQYALTELFERSVEVANGQPPHLSRAVYQASGGVLGALARRADELYTGLNTAGQETARQLFLRLVTLGEGTEDTRRRVLRAEVEALTTNQRPLTDDSRVAEAQGSKEEIRNPREASKIQNVIDIFGRYRLLTFDHDPLTRGPTVEVAHEALLREWGRLREWLAESRTDIRMQRLLATAAAEWREAKQDASFLLRGVRLDQFAGWAETTNLALTADERAFLEASLADHETRRAEEEGRQQRELGTAQQLAETESRRATEQARSAQRLRWLAVGLAVFLLVAISAAWFALNQSNIARRNAAESQNLALISGSQAALANGNTDQAIALALEAVTLDPLSTRAQVALGEATYALGTIRQFVGHTDEIWEIAFSPDGRTALTASGDKTLILWDIQTSQIIRRFEGHTDEVGSVAFSPDGLTALSGADDKTLILWDLQTGQIIRRFQGHEAKVYTVAMSPDGRTALSGGVDKTLILWDLQTGEIIRRFEGHSDVVRSVKFSPDGHTALSGSDDKTLILWDIQTGQVIHRLEGHANWINTVAFSPDDRPVISGADEVTMILWDLGTGQIIRRFYGHLGVVTAVAFSPDGSRVISGSPDTTLILWDIATGQPLSHLYGHEQSVETVAVSPDGRTALSGSLDGTMRLWDLEGGQVIRRFTGLTASGRTAYSPAEGGRTALIGLTDGAIVFDLQTGQEMRRIASPRVVIGVAYSPDNRTALLATGDYGVEPSDVILWDVETGQEIRRFVGHPGGVVGVDFSPDGHTAVSSGAKGAIILWDVATGQEIRRFRGYEGDDFDDTAFSAIFSPDGRTLLTGFGDGKLILWDVVTGQEIRQFVGHSYIVGRALFSPDGQHVFSGAWDNTTIYWDVATGSTIHRFTDHSAAVFQIELTPDGRFGLGGSADNTTILWDLQTGEVVRRYIGSNAGVYYAAFNPAQHGREAVVTFIDGSVALWRIDTSLGELMAWTRANRYIPELTCEQRTLYRLEPLCAEDVAMATP